MNAATVLAPPPVELNVPSVAFFGRTLAEYAQFFSLDVDALDELSVLDVAAGPSSFTAEACRRGADAVAVDPMYGCTPEALATHVQIDYDRMFAQIRAKPELVRFKSFRSIDEAELSRRSAADRFLTDYEQHFVHNRYLGAALPQLPFLDGAFDLVLCAHLLFVYANKFDYEFHLEACQELVRVSSGEVRIHPLVGLGGKVYNELDRLRSDLDNVGIASEVVRVDYEFFKGTSSMLVLRRRSS
ncbi:MAG: methyltransferase [Nibricoccus sp.]